MKKIVLIAFITISLFSCQEKPKITSQAGVYKLEKQVVNNGIKDTTYTGFVQYKMYTPNHYFYIAVGMDSSVGFGLGSYLLTEGKAVEHNIFNSTALDTAAEFKMDLIKTEKGYSQVIPEMLLQGKKYKLTEEYTSVDSKGASVVDGLWMQTKSFNIKGKDTLVNTYKEYKIYQGNHFMWAAHYLADTAKNIYKNAVGYGNYDLNKEEANETIAFSNFKELLNNTFNMKLVFNGTDEFTQITKDTANQIINHKTYKKVK